MKIALLSNVNIEPISKKIGKHDTYIPNGYGIWLQELLNPSSALYSFDPELVFLILDGEELFKDLDYAEKDINYYFDNFEVIIKKQKDKHFFISDIIFNDKKIYFNDEFRVKYKLEYIWYEKIHSLIKKYSNLHIFNLKALAIKLGIDNFYSDKLWYLGGIKFSAKAENFIIAEIESIINAYLGKRKKCIILDLDNTLWGGIVGEVGIEGIELSEFKEGARYKDFQKRLKEMKELGIILTIVSKNNEEDIEEVFEKHKHMVLKKEDFPVRKINWNPKSINIEEISKVLNIGVNSMVFIDDNPVERELVKKALPEIFVAPFPKDTSQLTNFANYIYKENFYTIRYTNEDLKKTEQYIQNAKRSELKTKLGSEEEFLKSLETKIYIWQLIEEDIPRAAQLSQKTNQFNLTTKRYTERDVYRFMNSREYEIYIASVEDKFGDNGKVALVIIEKDTENKIAKLDTFLMSCRVMGRYIEDQIIEFIENKLRKENFEKIVAYYIPTKRNIPVKNLFERFGYRVVNENKGIKVYEYNLKDFKNRKKYAELIEK